MLNERDVAERVQRVRDQIEATPREYTHRVDLLAVTKGFGPWAIEAALRAGCSAIGENYAQELVGKRDEIERLGPEVHFIGRLQTNKVRHLVDLVDVWGSIDRASAIREVAKRCPGARIMVQVDTTGNPGKGGCALEETVGLVSEAIAAGLVVDGLMTVGPTGQPPEAARPGFAEVRALVDDLGLAVCSMGMSSDLAVAVQEGSTQVRIGTGLFGPRV